MRILSIDWDYFFPNTLPYDWGHREAPFFIDAIWHTRCHSRNLITKEEAIETMTPDIPKHFWDIISNKPPMLIQDSHFQIWECLIQNARGCEVVSLDAHHDCGYPDQKHDFIDCANWARWGQITGRIAKMTLYYPEWRRKDREDQIPELVRPTIRYGLPKPNRYDYVFVCRSGAWTPAWQDPAFHQFINQSGLTHAGIPDVRMTIETAMQIREQMKKMYAQLMPSNA